jgi:hypothetical protein
MFNALSSLGWLCFAAGLVYYFSSSRSEDVKVIQQRVDETQTILLVAAGLIIAGYVIEFVRRKVKVAHHRCKVCGKKIDSAEIYCFDHRRDAIWEAREKYRLEGTDKFTRSQKGAGRAQH